jgi:hypothetical protein
MESFMNVRLYTLGAAVCVGITLAQPAAAQDRLVHRGTDQNTGAVVRVFKTSTGGRIELETTELKLSKEVKGSQVVTRMREGRDELVLSLDEKKLAVATPAGRVSAARTDRKALERLRQLVAASAVGRKTAALIGKLGFGAATPVHPMLVTTRAFLMTAAGERMTRGDLGGWARQAQPKAQSGQALKVSLQEQEMITPTDCWNAYSKEAIAAWIEYEDCMEDVEWWEFLGATGCAAVYEMRALGAFSWWLKCVSLY